MVKKFLHVGSGKLTKANTTDVFRSNDWDEVRLDIDKEVNPDIVASLTDMSIIEDNTYDAVYSHHNIEHLYAYQVPIALREMSRVLNDDGFLIISCPDLQSVCAKVAENRKDSLVQTLYVSGLGPITPVDILYGLRSSLEKGNHYMAHNVGFTKDTLQATLLDNGFGSCLIAQWAPTYVLWGIAYKNSDIPQNELKDHLIKHTNHTPLRWS
jgi:SAM-dependent methyltransferase